MQASASREHSKQTTPWCVSNALTQSQPFSLLFSIHHLHVPLILVSSRRMAERVVGDRRRSKNARSTGNPLLNHRSPCEFLVAASPKLTFAGQQAQAECPHIRCVQLSSIFPWEHIHPLPTALWHRSTGPQRLSSGDQSPIRDRRAFSSPTPTPLSSPGRPIRALLSRVRSPS